MFVFIDLPAFNYYLIPGEGPKKPALWSVDLNVCSLSLSHLKITSMYLVIFKSNPLLLHKVPLEKAILKCLRYDHI